MNTPNKVVKTKLFIGNLDQNTQPSELTELFSPFGAVLEASVIKDYGFVHYGTVEEAEKAAAALNNKEFRGKRLRVELSTSTVRHRPGQPEPASALRNSRARAAAMASGNGVSRFSPAAPAGGIGPMRHSASAWLRGDARPYDGISIDPGVLAAGYGPAPSAYDRARPYDLRSDPRRYYAEGRESGYGPGPGYDPPRESLYGAPSYAGNGGSGQPGMFSMRDYRDLPPHARADSMGYSASRLDLSDAGIWTALLTLYDRNPGTSPVDPYYASGLPQGPPPSVDPYHAYDPYQKFYSTRGRDPEYPPAAAQNPPSRSDYDLYASYRGDPYAAAAAQQPLRHELAVALQQQQQQAAYAPASQQRQQQPYASASATAAASYAPALAQYYGAQQRA